MGSVLAFDVLCSLHSEATFHVGNGYNTNNKKYASDTNLNESMDSRVEDDFSGKFLFKHLGFWFLLLNWVYFATVCQFHHCAKIMILV